MSLLLLLPPGKHFTGLETAATLTQQSRTAAITGYAATVTIVNRKQGATISPLSTGVTFNG